MITSSAENAKIKVGFDLFDPFGTQRLREAYDIFDQLRFEKNRELNMYRDTVKRQGEMLSDYANRNKKLTDELIRLKNDYDDLKNLDKLSSELKAVKQDYRELSRQYDKIVGILREQCPNISVDDI